MGWLTLGIALLVVGLVALALRGPAMRLVFWVVAGEGGEMAEIEAVAIELGSTKRIRVTGRTRAGQPAALENLRADVTQSAERYSVGIEGNVLVIVSAILAGDLPTPIRDEAGEETGEMTPGIGPHDSSLAGALRVQADGRAGEGVRELDETLALNGHLSDAVDLIFEDISDGADAAAAAAGQQDAGGVHGEQV